MIHTNNDIHYRLKKQRVSSFPLIIMHVKLLQHRNTLYYGTNNTFVTLNSLELRTTICAWLEELLIHKTIEKNSWADE